MQSDDASAPEVPPSSRLCVKNIPKYVNEGRLKEFFGVKGEVTDVKVLRTKDGHSRQLGFIGFKSVEEAAAALRYYDRSYMDTMRLTVEFARKVGDDQLPRAWSKHTAGTSANRKLTAAAEPQGQVQAGEEDTGPKAKGVTKGNKGAKVEELLPEEEADPKLREFLALMQPRSKAKIWANDELQQQEDAAAAAAAGRAGAAAERQQRQKRQLGRGSDDGEGDGEEEDDGDYQDWTREAVARVHLGGGSGSGSEGGDSEEEEGSEGAAAAGGRRDEVVVNEAVSDLDYLRSRMRKWDEGDEEEDAAAARGDQSGLGTSPRCTAQQAAGGKAAKKGAAAAAAAARADAGAAGAERKGKRSGRSMSEEAEDDVNVNMHDAVDDAGDKGAAEQGQQQQWRPAHGAPGHGGAAAAEGEREDILETGRLFVRNLAYTATETDLSDLFGAHGDLQEVHLVLDRETKRSKGLAYVQFMMPEDAVRAAQQLDGTIYQGRLLHILPAKRQPGAAVGAGAAAGGAGLGEGEAGAQQPGGEGEGGAAGGPPGTSSFKAQREAQRKADAGNRAAWNTLFMRADTVAEAVAAHYGLSKAALLDAGGSAGGDSVAVRMALGEAQVIAGTKQALAEAGVNVETLEKAASASGKAAATRSVARSGTTLLVKNLPFSADEDELSALFGRCGPLARLVLPPARALALVEFTEPQDARSAFRSLAYKMYHHVPLYLEWAPADVFTGPAPPSKEPQQQGDQERKPGGKGAKAAPPELAATMAATTAAADGDTAADADGGAAAPGVVGTIYVKNLAFATSDAALRKHFDGAVSAVGGSLHSAVVARKKGKDGAVQSLGYGFVEVDSEAVAAAVIKKLQGSLLDGHKLALQLSKGRKSEGAAAAAPGAKKSSKKGGAAGEQEGSVKLVVRNLAFEATKKDIQGLFNPFGHLKSCRLPKKFDGSHRGFAFVEFVTKQEARNALEGVGGTHLYGRRLVVEYAREDDGLDELRNKTAAKFKRSEEVEAGGDAPAKRLKL